MIDLPPVPPVVKHVAHFLKVADDHDNRNIVVSYWSRMFACQTAMHFKDGVKPPEVTTLLIAIMDWLEKTKQANHDVDGITSETCAQAMIEEYCLQLFSYADAQDRAEVYNKNVIKAFYTCGILLDVLTQFGPLSEEFFQKKKYAKWKAGYIHNCLKRGEKPTPGPPKERIVDSDDSDEDFQRTRGPYKNIQRDFSDETSLDPNVHDVDNPLLPPPERPAEATTPSEPTPMIPPPSIAPPPVVSPTSSSSRSTAVGPEQIEKAQKFCKFAGSALNYDDVNSAIDNLQKALNLLQIGREQ